MVGCRLPHPCRTAQRHSHDRRSHRCRSPLFRRSPRRLMIDKHPSVEFPRQDESRFPSDDAPAGLISGQQNMAFCWGVGSAVDLQKPLAPDTYNFTSMEERAAGSRASTACWSSRIMAFNRSFCSAFLLGGKRSGRRALKNLHVPKQNFLRVHARFFAACAPQGVCAVLAGAPDTFVIRQLKPQHFLPPDDIDHP